MNDLKGLAEMKSCSLGTYFRMQIHKMTSAATISFYGYSPARPLFALGTGKLWRFPWPVGINYQLHSLLLSATKGEQ